MEVRPESCMQAEQDVVNEPRKKNRKNFQLPSFVEAQYIVTQSMESARLVSQKTFAAMRSERRATGSNDEWTGILPLKKQQPTLTHRYHDALFYCIMQKRALDCRKQTRKTQSATRVTKILKGLLVPARVSLPLTCMGGICNLIDNKSKNKKSSNTATPVHPLQLRLMTYRRNTYFSFPTREPVSTYVNVFVVVMFSGRQENPPKEQNQHQHRQHNTRVDCLAMKLPSATLMLLMGGATAFAPAKPSFTRQQSTLNAVSKKDSYSVTLLPGDGIGPEITEATKEVLAALCKKCGFEIELKEALIGGCAIDEKNDPFPDESLEQCRNSDSILLASIGGYKVRMDGVHLISK